MKNNYLIAEVMDIICSDYIMTLELASPDFYNNIVRIDIELDEVSRNISVGDLLKLDINNLKEYNIYTVNNYGEKTKRLGR